MTTATDNRSIYQNMVSKISGLGFGAPITIPEPKSESIQDGTVAIIAARGRIDETVLNAPREIHEYVLRRYALLFREPQEDVEYEMERWRFALLKAFWGDFDLGGTVAYLLPTEFNWQYGHLTIGNIVYRYMDLNIAYRLDPSMTFTQ